MSRLVPVILIFILSATPALAGQKGPTGGGQSAVARTTRAQPNKPALGKLWQSKKDNMDAATIRK